MKNPDRLYELLPVIYRQRDAEQGYPLRALLGVIAEQVEVVENDINQLYANWFIETCQDWVVPYIGDLVGYRIVHEAGEPGDVNTPEERQRNKILIPRREVANTIRYRRRKGTLALLEELAFAVAGWPGRAVEFDRFVSVTQWLNRPQPLRGRAVDLHQVDALKLLGTPFDKSSRTVDLRTPGPATLHGTANIHSVGLFLWRLRTYPITRTPAYCLEEEGNRYFTFSILGNDMPLYNQPDPTNPPTEIIDELDVPVPIRREAFAKPVDEPGGVRYQASENYYGEGKSVSISTDGWGDPIPAEKIIPADLSDWKYLPRKGCIAVDPELGRIAFPPNELPKQDVWVSYCYGFAADIGSGPYRRPVVRLQEYSRIYSVGLTAEFQYIDDAYKQWRDDRSKQAIIEITDNRVYQEQLRIRLGKDEILELRAANGVRPVIYGIDWQAGRRDAFVVEGDVGSVFCLEGILVAGRGIEVAGNLKIFQVRHSTLVPGWGLHHDCRPRRAGEPSLAFANTVPHVRIEHSIVGRVEVIQEKRHVDPLPMHISDSIVDGLKDDSLAIGLPNGVVAPTVLTVYRSTIIGQVQAHAIALAENSIFTGKVLVARRQQGCMRFCYVPSESRTPRRYECEPDLVDKLADDLAKHTHLSAEETEALRSTERLRIEPQFVSTRYGKPEYCKLAVHCADEIKRGAADESEIGVFHDLFDPQREANLRARLQEYVPAGVNAGIIFAS